MQINTWLYKLFMNTLWIIFNLNSDLLLFKYMSSDIKFTLICFYYVITWKHTWNSYFIANVFNSMFYNSNFNETLYLNWENVIIEPESARSGFNNPPNLFGIHQSGILGTTFEFLFKLTTNVKQFFSGQYFWLINKIRFICEVF